MWKLKIANGEKTPLEITAKEVNFDNHYLVEITDIQPEKISLIIMPNQDELEELTEDTASLLLPYQNIIYAKKLKKQLKEVEPATEKTDEFTD